jgi:hypothetical protein
MPEKSALFVKGDAERRLFIDLFFVCGVVSFFIAVNRAKRQQENKWETQKLHHGKSHR